MTAPFNALPASVSGSEDEALFLSGGVFIDPTPTVVGDVDSAIISSHLTVADGYFAAVSSTAAVITGHGTSDLTVSGSVADVNYVLYTLGYVPAPDVNGTRIITVETSDGELTDTDTITLTLSAMPDAPAGTDRSLDLAEDGTRPLEAADFGFSDVDGDGMAEVLVVATPAHGTIHNAGGYIVMIDVDGDGSPELVTTQTPFDYAAGQTIAKTHLDGGYVSYVPDPDYAGPDSFTFQVVDDSGAPYGYKVDPTSNTLDFNITEINDAPDLDLNGADPGTSHAIVFTENQAATLLAPNSIVTDPDALDYENGTLTVEFTAGASFDDQLQILDSGSLDIEENSISVADTAIGYFYGGTDASQPLVITFNEAATPAMVGEVVRAIAFANFSDTPEEGTRTLTFTLTDGVGGTSAPVTATVDVTAVEDGAIALNDFVGTGDNLVLEGSVLADNGDGMDYDPDGPAPVVTEVNGVAADLGSEIVLASGAKLTLNADGTFSYDPNHVFEYLISFEKAAQTFAFNVGPLTDSFTYTITGGATATVTIHIDATDGPGDELRGDEDGNFLLGTEGADLFVLSQGGDDIARGLGGDDIFDFGDAFTAADSVDGGAGADTLMIQGDHFNPQLVLGPTTLTSVETIILGEAGDYSIVTVDDTVSAGGVLRVDGSALVQTVIDFYGMAETDGSFILLGGDGPDHLYGGAGDDVLVGGDSINTLYGSSGLGDTADYSAAPGSVVGDLANGEAGKNGYGYSDFLYLIENLTGSAFADILTGDGQGNRLDGGLGADLMTGNGGNDAYVVDQAGDQAVEKSAAGGVDIVRSSVSFSLGQHLENLELTGTGAINGTGNELANILTGNTNDNILDGGLGADFMLGGLGNDTYIVDDEGDAASELLGQGIDTVQSAISYSLGSYVEDLVLTGAASIHGTGNGLDNNLTGNSAANILNGGAGADRMTGDGGDDTYIVDNAGDVVIEAGAADGTDTVRSSVGFMLGDFVDNLALTGAAAINGTGNGLANSLAGNNAANILDGGAGADWMKGDGGDDTYVVDNVGDVVIENSAGDGTDTVRSRVSFSLAGQQLEHLVLTGSSAINGTGNGLANNLNGNNAANILNGGVGADRMKGDGGDDLYVVDHVGDVVIENSALDGTDTVRSSVSYAIGGFVENLMLTGSNAIDGTGNGLANSLTGNGAANILDGGAGADRMKGDGGDDIYVVDHAGDVVIENFALDGVDIVQASVSHALGVFVEDLVLTGNALDGTGNGLDNVITGNNQANLLRGQSGNDMLSGGIGADTLQGGVGDDHLHGGSGMDSLAGGAGQDGFHFDTVLGATRNVDAILDFNAADDTIFLDADIFTGIAADILGEAAFHLGSFAADCDDRILYNAVTGHLLYDSDGVGGAAAILFATVTPGLALTSADFIVY